jgi:hypothetical protein
MADYLADVKMPPKEVEPEPLPEPSPELELELNDSVEEAEVEVEDDPIPIPSPPPAKREKLRKEDIFKKKINEGEPPMIQKVAPVKKKRVMTEKQKEALARGREKSAATRAAKTELKKKIQMEKDTARKEKKAAQDVVKQEKKEIIDSAMKYQHQVTMNKKDIEDATEAAIEKYEAKRKARKEVKRKEQAKEKHEAKVFKDINNAISRNNDGWGICFQ